MLKIDRKWPRSLDQTDGSENGSDEILEAGVGEDAPVQIRAVLLSSADRDWGNSSNGR